MGPARAVRPWAPAALSPEAQAERRLAWIVRHPGRLARLIECETAEEIHATLMEAAASLPASLRPTGKAAGR